MSHWLVNKRVIRVVPRTRNAGRAIKLAVTYRNFLRLEIFYTSPLNVRIEIFLRAKSRPSRGYRENITSQRTWSRYSFHSNLDRSELLPQTPTCIWVNQFLIFITLFKPLDKSQTSFKLLTRDVMFACHPAEYTPWTNSSTNESYALFHVHETRAELQKVNNLRSLSATSNAGRAIKLAVSIEIFYIYKFSIQVL